MTSRAEAALPCAVCRETEAEIVGEKDGHLIGTCTTCGLLRTITAPANPLALYQIPGEYHTRLQQEIGHVPYVDRVEHDTTLAAGRWQKFQRLQRVLDVGAANGAFAAYVQHQVGIAAEALEPNDEMRAFIAQTHQIPTHADWSTVQGRFTGVFMHDVLEHVRRPRKDLHNAALALYTGGVLVVDTPDAGCDDYKRLGLAWHHIRPREHLWYFEERSLVGLVREVGLDVIRVDRPIPGKLVLYAVRP
jgi:SAM-dependent methyltransferase